MPSTLMLLSNPYRPDPRVLRESRELIKSGINVHLIAWDRDAGLPEKAIEDGIQVMRVGPRAPFRSILKVAARLPRFWLRSMLISRKLKFDILHANDFDTLPLGICLSRLSGKPLLYDAHDLYAKMIEKDVGGLSHLVWRAELCMAGKANAIVTTSEPFARELSKGKRKVHIVTNSPDPSVLEGSDKAAVRKKYGLSGFVVSYLGSLEPGRFVEELCRAFGPGDGVTLAIGGNGTLRGIPMKVAEDNRAVRFLGTIPTDEALRVTWASDLVVCMLDASNPNYRSSIPVKILDAMASSRPVVTTKGLDMAEKVERAGCGFVISYDPEEFKKTVMKAKDSPALIDEMGRRGRVYYDRELSWAKSRDELLAVYGALLGPHRT